MVVSDLKIHLMFGLGLNINVTTGNVTTPAYTSMEFVIADKGKRKDNKIKACLDRG